MDSNRLEIIKSLQVAFDHVPTYDELADFIIEDRRRIIKPLIDFSNIKHNYDTWEMDAGKAMVETLKLAGIEEMENK